MEKFRERQVSNSMGNGRGKLQQRVFSNSTRELPLDASESFGGYSVILGKKHRLTPPGISLRYGVGISIILSDSAFKYCYNRGYSAILLGITA